MSTPILKSAGVPLITSSGVPATSTDCCCPGDCTLCQGTTTPLRVQVEFSGIVNGTCGSGCQTLNTTTYELYQESGDYCEWLKDISECSGDIEMVDVQVAKPLSYYYVNAYLYAPSAGVTPWEARWITSSLGTSVIDCSITRTLSYHSQGGAGRSCDYSSSSCTVTPL